MRSPVDEIEDCADSYFNTRDFELYCRAVLSAVCGPDAGATIRSIHGSLGERAKPRWTFDALEALEAQGLIFQIGFKPTRWQLVNVRAPRTLRDADTVRYGYLHSPFANSDIMKI